MSDDFSMVSMIDPRTMRLILLLPQLNSLNSSNSQLKFVKVLLRNLVYATILMNLSFSTCRFYRVTNLS